jgi:hypothetical protein
MNESEFFFGKKVVTAETPPTALSGDPEWRAIENVESLANVAAKYKLSNEQLMRACCQPFTEATVQDVNDFLYPRVESEYIFSSPHPQLGLPFVIQPTPEQLVDLNKMLAKYVNDCCVTVECGDVDYPVTHAELSMEPITATPQIQRQLHATLKAADEYKSIMGMESAPLVIHLLQQSVIERRTGSVHSAILLHRAAEEIARLTDMLESKETQ